MMPTGAVWLLVAGALSSPDVSGLVARTLAPTFVVREVAAAAARYLSAPHWRTFGR